VQHGVAALEEVEAERRRQGGDGDHRFGGAEPDERARDPIRGAAADDAPQRQPRHEDRPDRAGGVDGDAEHQADQPQPEHLINQRAGAGEEEESGEEDQQSGNGADPSVIHEARGKGGICWANAALCHRVSTATHDSVPDTRSVRARAGARFGARHHTRAHVTVPDTLLCARRSRFGA
jgi:hypothetical protein